MELIGICSVCRKAGKMHTCPLCGNMVCKSCYDVSKGMCKRCARSPGKMIK